MRGIIDNLKVTVGLPASGKTTWAKKFSRNNETYSHCELDKRQGILGDKIKGILSYRQNYKNYIFDGLFLTKDDLVKLLMKMAELKVIVKNVEIVYWTIDREACIWNDLYRRGVDSGITIANAKVDFYKDIKKIEADFPEINFKFKKNKVIKKEPYEVFASKYDINMDEHGIHKGDSWCTGGTFKTCWGYGGTVSADSPPSGVYALDNLLEKVAPKITFLEYKKIMNSCVDIEEFGDSDYYGGRTYHNQHVINVKYLYEYLLKESLIEEIE